MADTAVPPIKLPKPLPKWQVILSTVLLPVCLVGIATASVGLFVLSGETVPQKIFL